MTTSEIEYRLQADERAFLDWAARLADERAAAWRDTPEGAAAMDKLEKEQK